MTDIQEIHGAPPSGSRDEQSGRPWAATQLKAGVAVTSLWLLEEMKGWHDRRMAALAEIRVVTTDTLRNEPVTTMSTDRVKEPPFWKRVIIGVICGYPLILLLRLALAPVTGGLPWGVALLPNVIVLSTLLTYPVIPWVTRLLRPWLYPK